MGLGNYIISCDYMTNFSPGLLPSAVEIEKLWATQDWRRQRKAHAAELQSQPPTPSNRWSQVSDVWYRLPSPHRTDQPQPVTQPVPVMRLVIIEDGRKNERTPQHYFVGTYFYTWVWEALWEQYTLSKNTTQSILAQSVVQRANH